MVKSSCPSKEKALLLCRQLLARLWVDRVGSGGRWGQPREEMGGGLKERVLLPRSGYTSPALQIIDSSPEEVSMWVVVWIQPINKFSIGLLAGGAKFFISARNSYPRDTCHRKSFPLVLYIPPQPDLTCELKDHSDVLIRTIFLSFSYNRMFSFFHFFSFVLFSLF